jgi:membrane protease YdiL (CAAX protease family)
VLPAAIVFAAWGALLVWTRVTWPTGSEPPTGWQSLYPYTLSERVLFLFVALSAGVCEETIYRGFALRVLRGRGWRLWQAILLAGISFALIHGLLGAMALPLFLISALIFSALFLWRGNLWLAIYVHVMWDMMTVLAV